MFITTLTMSTKIITEEVKKKKRPELVESQGQKHATASKPQPKEGEGGTGIRILRGLGERGGEGTSADSWG